MHWSHRLDINRSYIILFKSLGLLAALLFAGSATVAFAQAGGGAATGALVGAPAGIQGATGNTSAGFGRSGRAGSAGAPTGTTNPSNSIGASMSGGSAGTPTGPSSPNAPK